MTELPTQKCVTNKCKRRHPVKRTKEASQIAHRVCCCREMQNISDYTQRIQRLNRSDANQSNVKESSDLGC